MITSDNFITRWAMKYNYKNESVTFRVIFDKYFRPDLFESITKFQYKELSNNLTLKNKARNEIKWPTSTELKEKSEKSDLDTEVEVKCQRYLNHMIKKFNFELIDMSINLLYFTTAGGILLNKNFRRNKTIKISLLSLFFFLFNVNLALLVFYYHNPYEESLKKHFTKEIDKYNYFENKNY